MAGLDDARWVPPGLVLAQPLEQILEREGFAAAIKADLDAAYAAELDAYMQEEFGWLENWRPTGLVPPGGEIPPAFRRASPRP